MPAQPAWFHRLDEILGHPIAKYFRGFNQVVQPDEGCAARQSATPVAHAIPGNLSASSKSATSWRVSASILARSRM